MLNSLGRRQHRQRAVIPNPGRVSGKQLKQRAGYKAAAGGEEAAANDAACGGGKEGVPGLGVASQVCQESGNLTGQQQGIGY